MKQNPASPHLTHATGAPVSDNLNIQTAGPRGPTLLQDIWLIEKLAHFDREVIPERRMHARVGRIDCARERGTVRKNVYGRRRRVRTIRAVLQPARYP